MTTEINQATLEKLPSVKRLDKAGRKRAASTSVLEVRARITAESSIDRDVLIRRMLVYGVLLCIGIIGLYLSSEKQFAAAKTLYTAVMEITEQSAILRFQLALLFFGEINAILSMAIANTLPINIVKIGNRSINTTALTCYLWAVVSSSIAIVSNVTITVNKYSAVQNVAVLALIETLLPPFAALWVGWTGERLWHVWSKAASNMREWKADPTSHPAYRKSLQDNILAELYKYAGNRELLENDRDLRRLVYNIELAELHDNLDVFDVSALLVNPTTSQNQN